MKKLSFIIILLSAFCYVQAQDYIYGIDFGNTKYPYNKWTHEVIDKANTCKDVGYMTEEEKKLVFLCNLVRTDGKLFAQTFYKEYCDINRIRDNEYTTSLSAEMNKIKKLPCLKPQKDLCKAAEDFAIKSGNSGKTGNKNYKSRYSKMTKMYGAIAENYTYGSAEAIKIMMIMLIDEGNPDKSNRRNLFSKQIDCTGISIKPHTKFGYNAVMNFAKTK